MKQYTLCLLIKDDQVLLAKKMRGHGEGKWNGFGGKPNEGENIEDAALRETQEEIGITPQSLEHVATVNYHELWNLTIAVFICRTWEGEPQASEEMGDPTWYSKDKLPSEMWTDDMVWWNKILNGEKVQVDFHYDEEGKVKDILFSPLYS